MSWMFTLTINKSLFQISLFIRHMLSSSLNNGIKWAEVGKMWVEVGSNIL